MSKDLFHKGRITPGPVGWTRIAAPLVIALVAVPLVLWMRGAEALLVAAAFIVLFTALAVREWMNQSLTFIVDPEGITVSRGGFWPARTWPAEEFRTVQIRRIPGDQVGTQVGGFGLRRGRVLRAQMSAIEEVDGLRRLTAVDERQDAECAVTKGGRIVEVVGHRGRSFLLSPVDPDAAAHTLAQVIRAKR